MIWLQPTPWARWLAAGLIAMTAMWIELRPSGLVDHPFATVDIMPGEVIDSSNTEQRPTSTGLLETVSVGSIARFPVSRGEPVLASDVTASKQIVPSGWYQVEMTLPAGATVGDPARLILIDNGTSADGVVTVAADGDPLGTHLGTVAVEPGMADRVAIAAEEGRVAILIRTP